MTDAWGAVLDTAKGRHYGTSKADIDAYASAGGAAAGTAACAAAGAAAASPLCAELGGAIGGAVADAIQSIGSAIFGGSDDPNINDKWNPVADAAIRKLVLAKRKLEGLPTTGPPGGSARNWPEWRPIAAMWAKAANSSARERGSQIVWWYEEPPADAGRIRGDAMDQWWASMGTITPLPKGLPKLTIGQATAAIGGLGQDIVTASAATGVSLAPSSAGGGSIVVPVLLAVAVAVGGVFWYRGRKRG